MSSNTSTKQKKQKKARTAAASTFSQLAIEDAEPSAYVAGFSAKATAPQTANSGLNTQRYVESSKMAVSTGAELPHDPELDALVEKEAEGALDTNLAEMSLGERLIARNAASGLPVDDWKRNSKSDDEKEPAEQQGKRKKKRLVTTVPSHSLTRTLIQALHAGDTSLLEACLTHSDETLIKSTIMRLPPQLAVPMLTACVERLGRGSRGNGLKGRGGGASAQRGMALIKWIRAVLIIHGGHLMTMPDLIARLSHLYSTLTTRLSLQERLLTLSGRLDLVLSQVELRSSDAPVPLPMHRKKIKRRGKVKREPLKYVEGESSEEEDNDKAVEVSGEESSGDEEGSVEDIELGGSEEGSEEEGEEEEEEEEEEEGEESDENNLVNGFIDDEASEDYEEDESEEESE